MQTKVQRHDNESSAAVADQAAKQDAQAGSAAFSDLLPEFVAQHRHSDLANAGRRVSQHPASGIRHPASMVDQLTQRIWKEIFTHNPVRSDLYDIGGVRTHAARDRLPRFF